MRKLLYAAVLFTLSISATAQQSKKPTILALSPHVVEMLFAVGAGEQIIATTDFADYPEAARDIPRVGNYARLQIEKVVELQPDLIIAWKSGNPADDLQRLQKLGFKLVYSEPKTLLDVAKEMQHFANLTGNTATGNKAAKQYIDRLNNITGLYKNTTPINVFYELWSRPLSTIAKGSWPQLLLDVCGAVNPFYEASNSYPQVGIEQVLVKDIQLIIQPLSENQKDKEGFNWSEWKALEAVTHNQLVQPDADQLHRMTPRVLDELASLCLSIDKTRQFYKNLAQ